MHYAQANSDRCDNKLSDASSQRSNPRVPMAYTTPVVMVSFYDCRKIICH